MGLNTSVNYWPKKWNRVLNGEKCATYAVSHYFDTNMW